MKNRGYDIAKPINHINNLISHFSPEATRVYKKENVKIFFNKKNFGYCYLLIEGEGAIRSTTDNRVIANVTAPFILGFGIDANTYLQTLSECTLDVLTSDRAHEIIQQKQLWEPMFHIYRRIASFAYLRAQALSRPTSRQVVLALLNNLLHEPLEYRYTISVARYLQEHSTMSKSNIYSILAELKDEGTVIIKNSRLMSINQPYK
jgi:Winged helix-turn-helix DNA binding